MLPNQGDGTFTFSIYADDSNGNSTLLGWRTITCSNSTSTTPFGAIDTPSQGQTVSGLVNNFGWVLSRGTRRADPPSGGSVNVVIDGAVVGSPGGWTNRSDLTNLFPAAQYSGVGSALGVLTFDSSTLTKWCAYDSVGCHRQLWFVGGNRKPVFHGRQWVGQQRHSDRSHGLFATGFRRRFTGSPRIRFWWLRFVVTDLTARES